MSEFNTRKYFIPQSVFLPNPLICLLKLKKYEYVQVQYNSCINVQETDTMIVDLHCKLKKKIKHICGITKVHITNAVLV